MKTITIPVRFGYPTVEITINGKEQTFVSGEEIRVENAIAEAIENALALAPKIGLNISKVAQFAEGSIKEITEIDLDGIDTITTYGLAYRKYLTKISIPNCVKNIEAYAIYGCSSLESAKVGNSVTKIGANAFDWCAKLSRVYLPETPPTLADVNAFNNINVNCVFYCKTQASLEAYKKAVNWSTLTGTYTFVVEEKNG